MNSKLWKIGLAALVVGIVATTAQADEFITKRIDIDFPPVDSSDVRVANGLATSQINDSLFFFSDVFTCDEPYANIVVNFVVVTKDTATATGLCRDSATFILQTRFREDSIKIWRTIGASTKYPLAAWDSTGLATVAAIHDSTMKTSRRPVEAYPSPTSLYTGAATGIGAPYRGLSGARISVSDADSVAAMGDEFRIMTLYSAEEDSLKSHCALKSSATIDVLTKLKAIIRFKTR